MGIITAFVTLLKFALLSIDLLAWPAIALCYPLFASIRAVEGDSKYHMKKLVIYWTLFSLFSLFEFAFVKIIEWIPFWSSVRVVVIYWLVKPQFDGSYHVYQGLVRPILLVKIPAAIDRFHQLKERICKRETVLDVVEKYIKENGPEAVEKLIALEHENRKRIKSQRETKVLDSEGKIAVERSKQLIEPQAVRRDSETIEATEKIAPATKSNQVPHAQSTSVILKDAITNVEERTTPEANADNRHSKTPLMNTQKEWTCDLCKFTATSEIILNDHLQGGKHKSKLESLKASMLGPKYTGPSPSVPHAQSTSVILKDAATIVEEKTTPKANADNRLSKAPPLMNTQQEWTCDLCKVTTTSEKILNDHLQGKKHKSKLESLKSSMLAPKDTGTSPSVQQKQSVSAAKVKTIMPTTETAEKRCRETPPFKNALQEWTVKEGNLGAKVTGPSHSLTSKLNLADVSQNFIKESGSELESIITSKVQIEAKEASVENRRPETLPLKQASQEWILKASNFGAKVTDPSHSATTKLNLANVSQKSNKESGSEMEKIITSKVQVEAEGTTPSEACTENRHPETYPLKQARQEWDLKASNICAKVTGPSHSATSELNVANVSQKFIEGSGSVLEKIISSKVQIEAKETTPPVASAENRHVETPPFKLAQQEWTCHLCKVSVMGEKTLNHHFMGRKHKAKLKSLETSEFCAKNAELSSLATCEVNKDGEGILRKGEMSEQWCFECNVKLHDDVDLASHLKGKQHSSNIETLIFYGL